MRHPPRPREGRDPGDVEHPTRAHGAAGRRGIWARRLGASEAQIAWWSKLGRFSKIAERAFSDWKAVTDDELGPQLRRELRGRSLGEALLLIEFANYLHAAADSPSQLQLMLNSSGRVEIRLQDDEDEQVTPDESWMAYLLNGAIRARRRKRSRLARIRHLLAARLGRGPARVGEQELYEGLAERGWKQVDPEASHRGVQQAYVFVMPDLAEFFTVQVAALLGVAWEDLRFELGVCQNVATVIVFGHRWLWPPAHVFDALDAVAQLAKERHGRAGELGGEEVSAE